MRKFTKLSAALAIGILGLLVGGQSACAQSAQYHGGPVLETYTIYPLYWGKWSKKDIDAQQDFLKNLADYISGDHAPAGHQPMLKQYGVNSASVAAARTAEPNKTCNTICLLTREQIAGCKGCPVSSTSIIAQSQSTKDLTPFGPNTLILVFLPHGFGLTDGASYHSSQSTSEFWAVVPQDVGPNMQVVTAHEVFEASADPADDNFKGWDEVVDPCENPPFIALEDFGRIQIPRATDNTRNGTCSTTGYTSTDEIQVYGWSYTNYRKKYDELWPRGWRLYILQSYVMSNGQVLYNAVWRPGNMPEIQVYGWSYADYRKKYDELFPQGWRLYILDSFVTGDGQVLYNAVWRQGTVDRPL